MLRVWSGYPPAPSDPPTNEVIATEVRCILALASSLLSYGLPAHRVSEAVLRLSRAFGRVVTVFTLPTYLSVTLHDPSGHQSHAVHAQPSTIDLARLDTLHRLVARLEARELTAGEAEQLVQTATSAPRRYARITELLAVTLVASGGTLALGGSFGDALAGALLGAQVGGLLWIGCIFPSLMRVLPVIAAALTMLCSSLLAGEGMLSHPLLAAFAALFVFVPGLSLTQSMTELATGHLVSGTARMMGALTVFLQLALGMLFGARVAAFRHVTVEALPPSRLEMAVLGAAILALGFAILFSVRYQDALATFFVSALAFATGRLSGAWLGAEIGALLSAFAVGLCSHAFARHYDRPSSVLALPGMAMLVPGSLGMLSISAAMLHFPARAFGLGFQMIMVMVSLSTGVLLAAAALPPRTEL